MASIRRLALVGLIALPGLAARVWAERTGDRAATGPAMVERPPSRPSAPAHPAAAFDARAFDRALARLPRESKPMPGVRAVILPHHWLAGELIVAGLRDLAASGRFDRVILMAPDHLHAGQGPVTTSDSPWRTSFGEMTADVSAVDRLVRSGLARRDPGLVDREHGVAGLVPAVVHYLPGARIVPLAVRNDLRPAALRALADELARLAADERTVIVLSADLSHGLESAAARRKDRETLEALAALGVERLRGFGPEHLDARGAGAALMQAMRRLGAVDFVLRANSDASAMPGYTGGPVTSYAVGYFRATAPPARP